LSRPAESRPARGRPADQPAGRPTQLLLDLQLPVPTQGLVELGHDRRRESTEEGTHAFHGHRPHLLGLSLRVHPETGAPGREQGLERVDAGGVAGHRDDRDDASTEAARGRVGAIVADDDRRAPLVLIC
jgi:hypothetical protein